MAKHILDQAEGLRRLVGAGSMQIIPVMSGGRGAGKTTAVANIASALASMGRDVLVIDDGSGAHGVCNSLGMQIQRCLTDVMAGRCSLEDVIVQGENGVRALPMGSRYRAMTEGSNSLPVPLDVWASQVHPAPDVVLVDLPGGKPALSQEGLQGLPDEVGPHAVLEVGPSVDLHLPALPVGRVGHHLALLVRQAPGVDPDHRARRQKDRRA